jgi:deoxyribose-phosphate aldolase
VNLRGLEASVKQIVSLNQVSSDVNRVAWALKALTLTDLTTLSGDDCASNVERLCFRACFPFTKHSVTIDSDNFLEKLHVTTAAVCVYPTKVKDAHTILKQLNMTDKIQIAAGEIENLIEFLIEIIFLLISFSVATGFPTGLYPLESRLDEITYAIDNGATEIDIVIDRSLVLTHNWTKLYEEVVAMRRACGNRAHMKTILGIGECGTMQNVYKASMVCMMAGADFIKTSTGKESVNATLPVGLCMIRAIKEFNELTGKRIGFKPAGGVRTVNDAIQWMTMIKETLGNDYLQPELFRFGASGLLDDIEKFVMSKCQF